MRNQLLNFRPGARSIQIVDEISTEIYDLLVIQEENMQFLQQPDEEQDKINDNDQINHDQINHDETSDLTKEEADILWELPPPNIDVAERHKDLFLQTELNSRDLQKRLRYTYQQAKSVFDEQGYNVLYIALGFIEWKESSDAQVFRKAPLILIPVELVRDKVSHPFELHWTGDDILTNISIKGKLIEHGVDLPDFEMPEEKNGIYEYFESVKSAISHINDWKVVNEIYISFFSFTKFVMYQDLDPQNWPNNQSFEQNSIIKDLFDHNSEIVDDFGFLEDEVDTKLKSKEIYNVLDADSSQIAVIEDVKSQKNLVVEGPPGTGKSQTIVNLIAELIMAGKTVLFVSEKIAALEVVKNRLDGVGLGRFCLELHSRKSNKKEVLGELERTLKESRETSFQLDEKFDELDNIKSDLNIYSDIIHQKVGTIGFTPFKLFGIKEEALIHFGRKKTEMPHIVYENIESYSLDDWNETLSKLNDMFEILKSLEPLSENTWRHTKPVTLFPADQDEIKRLLSESINTLQLIAEEISILSEITGIKKPENRQEITEYNEIVGIITNSDKIEREILENPEWNSINPNVQQIINELEKFKLKTNKFHLSVLSQDIHQLINKLREYSTGLFRVPSNVFVTYEDEIKSSLKNSNTYLENLNTNISILVNLTGVTTPYNKEELEESIKYSKFLVENGMVERQVLTNNNWNNSTHIPQQLIKDLQEFNIKFKDITPKFINNILDQDLKTILSDLKNLQGKRLKFLSGDYKKVKNQILSLYNSHTPTDEEMIVDLEELILCQGMRDGIRESESTARSYFGSHWNGEGTDPQALIELSSWIVNFRNLLLDGKITEKAVDIVSMGPDTDRINQTIISLQGYLNNLLGLLNTLNEFLALESIKNGYIFSEMKLENNTFALRVDQYFNFKQKISEFYIDDTKRSDEEMIVDLEELILCQGMRDGIRESESTARSYFGSHWNGEETDPQALIELSSWIVNFRNLLLDEKITEKAVDIVSMGPDIDKINQTQLKINEYYENFLTTLQNLKNYLNADLTTIYSEKFESVLFNDILDQMILFKNDLPNLLLWSHFLALKKEQNALTQPLIKLTEENVIEPEDMIPCFRGNFADNLLKIVFIKNPVLSNFVGDLHDNKIKKFTELDKELIFVNRKRIANEISGRKPDIYSRSSPNSELGILLGEFNRKRRHMSIRKLLTRSGGLIQTIKPCFMMSPLSIAQFIEPQNVGNILFDVIIFDEASQVKPEDALGALLRGKQLVVMGDTKQLPPTSFFDSMNDSSDNEDYDLATLGDMQSILHLCKRNFTTKMLRWHYRSRHESLIAVSNQEFYDNNLLIYPSPANGSDNLGLKFVHIPEAVYDRGRSSGNILEAKAVVKSVMSHYKEYGDTKSLGVGTFNTNQRRLIEDFLEIERKKDPSMEEYFSETREEKFFIKNLETIQGDERDVILVSVGFGFDSEHKLSQNFGPINKDGGERRLNVLFTRARDKCVIFANFKHSDLKIGPNSSRGLRSLKTFLEYAETRQLGSTELIREDSDSPFEDSVYEFLRDYGFEVHKQVGCAGFRIDLAIVDPKSPEKYLLGIECDGAMYHSSQVARDRDILRQQVLEGLEWNIHRIWSTDWYRNRNLCIDRLLKSISEAPIKKNRPKVTYKEIEDSNEKPEEHPIKITESTIPEYEICNSLNIDNNCELHEKSKFELATAIDQIVKVEGPIHYTEVIKRIRNHWGLKKAGKRIQTVIQESAIIAEQNGQIIIKEDFYYNAKNSEIVIRKRTGGPPANIELISPEEIEKAGIMVIETQYATPLNDLIIQVARFFGINKTSKKTANKIKEVIECSVNNGNLVEMPNGMLNLPK